MIHEACWVGAASKLARSVVNCIRTRGMDGDVPQEVVRGKKGWAPLPRDVGQEFLNRSLNTTAPALLPLCSRSPPSSLPPSLPPPPLPADWFLRRSRPGRAASDGGRQDRRRSAGLPRLGQGSDLCRQSHHPGRPPSHRARADGGKVVSRFPARPKDSRRSNCRCGRNL